MQCSRRPRQEIPCPAGKSSQRKPQTCSLDDGEPTYRARASICKSLSVAWAAKRARDRVFQTALTTLDACMRRLKMEVIVCRQHLPACCCGVHEFSASW